MPRANRLALALALAIAGVSALAQATAPAPAVSASAPAASGAASVQDLAAARKAAAAAVGKADFARLLSGLADALPPQDAVALIAEYAPKVPDAAASKALCVRGGQLAILLGDFAQAADLLETAAFSLPGSRDDALILKSARCRLAAGDTAKAADRASLVGRAAASPAVALEAGIVAAWALLLDGDTSGASASSLRLLAQASPTGPEARELRFILWAAAPVAERAARAADLAAAFPGSIEASIAKSAGQPVGSTGVEASASLMPLPHWYLSGVLGGSAARPSTPAGTPSPTTTSSSAATPAAPAQAAPPAAQATPPAASPASGSAPVVASTSGSAALQAAAIRYQIGIFSDPRNAEALVAELGKKGFTARTEKRKVGERELVAVIVEGEGDGFVLKLKDAGYEAYPLF